MVSKVHTPRITNHVEKEQVSEDVSSKKNILEVQHSSSVPAPHVPLKSCASCGLGCYVYRQALRFYVMCTNCGIRTKLYGSKIEAVSVWNCRVVRTPEEVNALITKLYADTGRNFNQIKVLEWVLCEREEL